MKEEQNKKQQQHQKKQLQQTTTTTTTTATELAYDDTIKMLPPDKGIWKLWIPKHERQNLRQAREVENAQET